MKTSLIVFGAACLFAGGAEAEAIRTSFGANYIIERSPGIDLSRLPQNSDLKMVDGDIGHYAQALCSVDVQTQWAPDRCDVYVQADTSGTLVGYAVVSQTPKGTNLDTATTLGHEPGLRPKSCWVGGKIYKTGADYDETVGDPQADFEGRIMYSAWEKEPGNFLVSQVHPNDDLELGENQALGVWYIEKKARKLRITQERWNYCYKDNDVYIDDVFVLAISLIKQP